MRNSLRKRIPAITTQIPLSLEERSSVHLLNMSSSTNATTKQRKSAFFYDQHKKTRRKLTNLTVSHLSKIIYELKSLVGETAALAIFKRSLSLSAISFPWLLPDQPKKNAIEMLAHIQQQLQTRDNSIATAAQQTLWRNNCLLLTKLLGKQPANKRLQKSVISGLGFQTAIPDQRSMFKLHS